MKLKITKKHPEKGQKKQTLYGKRVNYRKEHLEKLGLAPRTALKRAYHLEHILYLLGTKEMWLYIGRDKWNNIPARIIYATLKGHKRLQKQSPKKDTFVVINVNTRKKEEIHIGCPLANQEERRKKLKKRRIEAGNYKRNLQNFGTGENRGEVKVFLC